MKRIVVFSLICSFAALHTFSQPARPQGPPAFHPPPSITVQGRGEVSAKPDRASVRLGAEVQAENAKDAQAQLNELMNAAIKAVKDAGIPEKSIQTTGLNLYPVYSNPRPRPVGAQTEEPRITGYRASNILQVQVDDLDLVGKVIDAGIEAGVNRLEGINFGLKNDLSHRQRALESATIQARQKAEAIARAMDARLGKVQAVIEGGGEISPMQPRFARMAAMDMAESTPVQPGELQIQETVMVTFDILQ